MEYFAFEPSTVPLTTVQEPTDTCLLQRAAGLYVGLGCRYSMRAWAMNFAVHLHLVLVATVVHSSLTTEGFKSWTKHGLHQIACDGSTEVLRWLRTLARSSNRPTPPAGENRRPNGSIPRAYRVDRCMIMSAIAVAEHGENMANR
jgi:hypothetical protein